MSSFTAARELDDTFDVAGAIADAFRALGKPEEARAGYAAALDKYRGALSLAAIEAAQAKLQELAAATALLRIDVNEVDAEILVDGTSAGRSPLSAPLGVDPGKHRLEIKKAGFVTLASDVDLKPGPTSSTFSLVPEIVLGKLSVTTKTSQGTAELLINGKVVGLLPWEGSLPVGTATLLARTGTATSVPVEVSIERDVPKSVALDLVTSTGKLEVSSPFPDVNIFVDGQLVGVQSWQGALPVGSHRLVLSRDGFNSQERLLEVKSNTTVSVMAGGWVASGGGANGRPAPRNERGLYVRLDLGFVVSKPSDGVTQHCDSVPTNSVCSNQGPYGGNLGLRVGYRFGWIAPELFGLGALDVSVVKAQYYATSTPTESPFYGPPRTEDYSFFRYGGAAGIAARATTPTRPVSATGSAGVGFFAMTGQYARLTTTPPQSVQGVSVPSVPQTLASSTEHTLAPGLFFDGGILIGSSPGTKLYLGLLLSLEFAPEHSPVAGVAGQLGRPSSTPYGTPALDIVSGTQVHFGPVLAFQFGY